MSKRAVIYARVSTDIQRDNYSIPVQIEGCMAYAKSRDYTIVGDWFVDPITCQDVPPDTPNAIRAFVDDHTSLELMRPGIIALGNFLKTAGADIVIVYILNRLARDSYTRQTLERQFEELGAKTEYVLGQYDDEYGEIRKDMDATFAKWENIERARRSREGKIRKAQSGKFVTGNPPYGYLKDKDSPSGLIIDEEISPIIKQIFNLYVMDRESIRSIVRILNNDNLPSPTGKQWARSTINNILRNEGYAGKYYYNRTVSKQWLGGRTVEARDSNEWIHIPIPAIITPYMFHQAQKRLLQNKKHTRRKPKRGRFYLLRGMVFCKKCLKPYVCQANNIGNRKQARPTLIYRHRLKEGHCMNRQISAPSLDNEVWERVAEIIMEPQKLFEGYEKSYEQNMQNQLLKQEQLKSLKEAEKSLKQKKAQLTLIYSDVEIGMSKEEYLEAKLLLDQQLSDVLDQVSEIEADLAALPTPADLETFTNFTAEIRQYINGNVNPPLNERRRLLELLNVKVWINEDGNMSIEGNFPQNRGGGDVMRALYWTQKSAQTTI